MTDEIIELARTPRPGTWGRTGHAGRRYVRTPEGSKKYGLPIGAPITRDAELRAQARGRSYNVPEDNAQFGSQAPAAGRTQRTAQEIVSAIRNAPAPRRVTPDGPKKVAVGQSGFSFPEGSRTFRPHDHDNFAIVRTPDYQLIVATDKGIAFELDGDLENELNAELDDDASVNFDADEPNPNALNDTDGNGKTGEADNTLPDATPRPDRVEDSPGFLSEERIQDILSGMEQSGLDQNTRDMTELQLRRNNDRIRQEYDAQSQADAPNPEDASSTPPMERTPQPTPERTTPTTPDTVQTKALEADPEIDAFRRRLNQMAERQTKKSGSSRRRSDKTPPAETEEEKRARAERELDAATRAAETPESIQRRIDDLRASQNRIDGHDRSGVPAQIKELEARRDELQRAQDENAAVPTQERTSDTALSDLEELARTRPNGVAEGTIGGKNVSIRRNRVSGDMEYSVDGTEAKDRNDVISQADASEENRDTTGMAASEMTDDEINNVLDDIHDLLSAGAISRRDARHRREELRAEQARRQGESVPAPEETSEPPQIIPDLTPIDSVEGLDSAERDDILNARPGDRFVTRDGLGTQSTWFVGNDGRVHPTNHPDNRGLALSDFATFDEDGHHTWADSGNSSNTNERPEAEPGDLATTSWARDAKPGAAAYGSDGVIAERNEDGTWNTPMGDVSESFFEPSDVESDDLPTVVRNEQDSDGRPVGATNELLDPEELRDVRPGDGITFVPESGDNVHAERRPDGDFNVTLSNGITAVISSDNILGDGRARVWHVPNRDLADRLSRKNLNDGDQVRSLDDILRLRPGSRIERRRRRQPTNSYTQREDGFWENENGLGLPPHRFRDPVRNGEMYVSHVADDNTDVADIPEPRVVENLDDYQIGDKISSHRHLRDMQAGQQVTLVIPSSRNGGQEAHVVLTRTNDETSLGGFMFLVGNAGRGYNSFGENNASLYQALHEGRVLFGNLNNLDGTDRARPEGDWSRERNIKAFDDGPLVSERDLRQYIAAQMTANAMQKSYFDPEMVDPDSPFRSQEFRIAFAKAAKQKYSTRDNPMRSKPASIRLAAEHLGLQYTDPGSTLLPDDLDMEDFRRQVHIGSTWYASGALAEGHNMGQEELDVTAADVKTALAILDNMLESDNIDDPDKILKRVFARQGSPLQQMNVAVAVAAYFKMQRLGPDGNPINNRPARQDDKRRNAELLRQMLREQLEGRKPGYYGVPEDHEFTMTHRRSAHVGQQITLHSQLQRPTVNSDNPDGADAESHSSNEVPDRTQQTRDPLRTPGTPDPKNPAVTYMGKSTDQARQDLKDQLAPGMRNKAWFEGSDGRHDGDEFAVVRDDEGKIVGYANWYVTRFDSEEDLAELEPGEDPLPPNYVLTGLYASSDHTGSGTALMEHLARQAKADNAELSVQGAVPSAKSFYAARGANMSERSSVGVWTNDARDRLAEGSTSITRRSSEDTTTSSDDPASVGSPQPTRQEELDAHSTVQAAYVDAVRNGGTMEYIQSVLGEEGVSALNDGTITMRSQFTRAWNQAHGIEDASSTPPADSVPVSGNESPIRVGDTLTAARLSDLSPGSAIRYTRRSDGRQSRYTLGADGTWRTDAGREVTPDQWTRAQFTVESIPESTQPDAPAPTGAPSAPRDGVQAGDVSATSAFRQGDTFRGENIRQLPVGAHIVGQSGREYRVTDTGISGLGGDRNVNFEFATVERNNASFTYQGDTAPNEPISAVGQTAPDPRRGTMVEARNVYDFPDGSLFRSSGGTVWRRSGRVMVSQSSGQRRYVSRLTGRYRYLGTDANSVPTGRARRNLPSLESAGLSRVSQADIERFDRPRQMPLNIAFDTSNTTPWRDYMDTAQGQSELLATLRAALPEGSRVSMRAGSHGFSASYTTPDGASGNMERHIRSAERIENAVARAGGASFMDVQDHLFAFYRQHGLREVEVHGLSSNNWNGAHTWIRRGARPDPTREADNFRTFHGLQQNLDRIIQRTENGDFPQYQEFLEEAKDLSRRMNDLYNNRMNMELDERQEQLYQLWRELTYLGEVRDSNGRTARGQRQSIGWALLGNRSSGAWYYGIWPLDRYFE